MKRFFSMAALAIAMLTLLAACGGESPKENSSDQTAGSSQKEQPDQPTGSNQVNTSPTETPEPVQVPAGDITALLMVDDVSALAGGVGLSTRQLDLKSMAAGVDPAQVEHMVSFDSLSFDTADGSQGLTLTVVHLNSENAASDQMELMLEEVPALEHLADGSGDASGFIEVNEGGMGSIVVFKKGEWVVMVHTAQPSGVEPLVDTAGVESLARLVASRL